MKENFSSCHKLGKNNLSLPQPTSVRIIDPENDYASKVPARRPEKSLKSQNEEASIPSFKLLDEDSDEGEPVVENKDDDDCKIITERSVFEHIRKKAKSLPSLAANPHTEYPPSEETLNLIRKLTRDRHLALSDTEDVLNLTEVSNPCEESSEPDGNTHSKILNGDTIFEHIRKKAKSFPRVDEIKSLSTKSYSTNFDFDSFADAKSNVFQKESLIVFDSEPVKMQETSQQAGKKTHKSPVLASSRQSCSFATAAETREVADPFLGFKSVFSFL